MLIVLVRLHSLLASMNDMVVPSVSLKKTQSCHDGFADAKSKLSASKANIVPPQRTKSVSAEIVPPSFKG